MNIKSITLSTICLATLAFADIPANIESAGIPWNREFDSNKMVRHDTFDPALTVAYSYSLNFVSGNFGSFASQSLMANFAYEFTPNLHLYANIGLGMPLYTNFNNKANFAREDLRQGNVSVLIPDISLEYKPSENTYIRLSYVNERDAFKAYGPHSFFHDYGYSRCTVLCH